MSRRRDKRRANKQTNNDSEVSGSQPQHQQPSSPEIEVETHEAPVDMVILNESGSSFGSEDDEQFHTAHDTTMLLQDSDGEEDNFSDEIDSIDEDFDEEDFSDQDDDKATSPSDEDDEDDDGEEDDEDEDEEEEDAMDLSDPIDNLKGRLKNEMQEHKEQLEMLKAQDPEFYEYLKQNDQRLLDFVPEEEGSEESGDEEGDEDGGHIGNASDAVEDGASSQDSDDSEVDDGAKVITTQQIEDWRQLVETKSQLRALHSLVVAFKCAAHAGDDQATAAETSLSLPYTLADENAFTELIIAVVRHVPPALHHHLKTEGKQTSILPSQSKHWTRHQMVVKTFVKSAMYLLSQLTDPAMVEFILRELDKSGGVVFFASQPRSKTCKEFLRFLIRHWSSVPTADETANSEAKETLRIVAFLCIRQLALLTAKCVPDLLNTIHKLTYQSFMASAKHTTFNTTQALAFMNNCLVELFAMEDERGSAYQFAFVSIRQLAIQLRAATTQHTQDTLQQVLNWQFIHAIRLWSRLIATVQTAAQNQKHSGAFDKLIFPLTQIAMGAVGLNSRRGPQFYLYQLHLLRALSDLSFRTQVFIPIVPHILEIIAELAADAGKIQPSTLKSIDVSTTLRAPKSMVHSKLYSDTVFDECMDLMMEALSAQCTSIAFPELVSSWTVRMKRIAKQTIVPRFNKQLMGLVQELERQRSVVQTRRRSRSVAFGPCDGDNCKRFALDGAADLNSAVRQTDLGRYVMACKRVREQRRLAMAANK